MYYFTYWTRPVIHFISAFNNALKTDWTVIALTNPKD